MVEFLGGKMLIIKNLHAQTGEQKILQGLDLTMEAGKVYALMGPNGSGKSSLCKILAGHPDYQVTEGQISYEYHRRYHNLLKMDATTRARNGVFLAYQQPIEISGLNNRVFLHNAMNAIVTHHGGDTLSEEEFDRVVQDKTAQIEMNEQYLNRGLNVDFSGGERKRNEILQMLLLQPRCVLLDEIDSGLDVDSLRIVAENINKMRSSQNTFLIVTHYPRILELVVPNVVHILSHGRIIKSSDKSLATYVERNGYDQLLKDESL